ncbi:PSF3 (YOL146W) [Zygosaccharomyces parabailii]|uniref:DNA replication complex GINS protein PSF3 n=1 Tax=Zygosaccharomyces bailii (strain CLIB 213 / ATCC 58445 / CBS 680 / BCRC 21525 / NBRC 1098 / NCYC 1416 / NRRL Y-2227) TaxID=1333698 RepID=A0A8J2X4V7_ZYGB2|nr:PSF3 (YOL146W) [Zygosaccharomyces parabailii]CDF87344.1 BN860_04280g1_1 [Zygosaccharomyces bailii CLIB 213]CDH15589.1 probable PSF3-Part of GINS, replication multiprotein complex [Zygosaccharomyces bailii ISA1307]SJM84952.1 probable DNA replication complex GINS protein PSF3 [Zygosaccharomyces bailii]
MGYYDVDDILADSADFSCKFQYDMPGLGYLEGNPGRSIDKNARLDLPLWLARILAIVGGADGEDDTDEVPPFVELLPADIFSPKVVNAIKADAVAIDLHSISSHFQALALKWIALFGDDKLAAVCSKMVLLRALEINAHAGSVNVYPAADSSSPFLLTLDEAEKKLYKKSHDAYREHKRWMVEN